MPGFPDDLADYVGFQWDDGNADKNWVLHRVTQVECEQIFFNRPIVVAPDHAHSKREGRSLALGVTSAGRHLCVIYTRRGDHIRVISARDMTQKERRVHDQA